MSLNLNRVHIYFIFFCSDIYAFLHIFDQRLYWKIHNKMFFFLFCFVLSRFHRHIIKGNLFAPVVDAFIRNNSRYNLLESAILELFEFIKAEDIKSLCTYVVENFSKIFDEIEYVQTFKHLKARYDQHQEMLKERDKILDRFVQKTENTFF